MKINIEIDVTPAELRRFLGLPDVAGLQEDMIEYVRGRVARGAENFDPVELLRESTAWGNRTLQWVLSLAAGRLSPDEVEEEVEETARQAKAEETAKQQSGKKPQRKRRS